MGDARVMVRGHSGAAPLWFEAVKKALETSGNRPGEIIFSGRIVVSASCLWFCSFLLR